jgi:hypothetical protein
VAALSEIQNPVKGLIIGNNGAGKTGALLSLIKAGYKLRLLDFDNGAEILVNLIRAQCPELASNVDIETHMDEYKSIGGKAGITPVTPLKGFSGGMKVLDEWPGLGKPTDWRTDTVLVLDSLTMLGKLIMNHVLFLAGRLVTGEKQMQDWGQAMDIQENVCARLFSSAFSCHVLVLSHVTFVQPEGEVQQFAYPSALGSKLPPKIGSYFNSTLYVGSDGVGANKKKVIYTKSKGLVECKTSAPGLVKDSYPLETGLADYFRDLGHIPPKAA